MSKFVFIKIAVFIDHQNFKLLYNFSEKCAANCSQQQKNTRLEALTKLSEEEKKLLQHHQKQLEDLQANQAIHISKLPKMKTFLKLKRVLKMFL